MVKDEMLTVKEAIHRLQLSLLEGIKHGDQLSAAGSLISRSDYQDVVTERSIANMCGFPLCSSSLPSERPWKGNYHVSLKEHRVYDLQETYKYCSNGCLINSRAFSGILKEDRSTMNSVKLIEVLDIFEQSGSLANMGTDEDLGFSELKIVEKNDSEFGEVSLEEWIGPSNAIEGYVPQRDWSRKPARPKNLHEGVRKKERQFDITSLDTNFMSTIITQDEHSISKTVSRLKADEPIKKLSSETLNDRGTLMQKVASPLGNSGEVRSKKLNKNDVIAKDDNLRVSDDPHYIQNKHMGNATKGEKEPCLNKESASGTTVLKSSLKTSDSKKETRSVTWADGQTQGDVLDLPNCKELKDTKGDLVASKDTKGDLVASKDTKGDLVASHSLNKEAGEDSYRIASAEACARALSQAAETVASGKSDVSDAVSEADITILPHAHGLGKANSQVNDDVQCIDSVLQKWPIKPGFSNDIDSEDSWYDILPEGFSLTLSPFSTMFMALFSWISSSSLAYIYGKDESFHENYLYVNEREYPRKIILLEGRSTEIKKTLAGCLARALPGLVTELRLPTPISTLEQGMGCLLETMSFLDPLPSFRMKQWQVVVLLFLDALSVSRIPALTAYMMGRRILLPKVLEVAQISQDEYEIMKDLIIPLGRVPQPSTQSGG